MSKVRPKKHLGQHFLNSNSIAERIVDSLTSHNAYQSIVEVGPGTGVLTQLLLQKPDLEFTALDVDEESLAHLREHYPGDKEKFIYQDFLSLDLKQFEGGVGIIGNFPYNISSQIFFHILKYEDKVLEVVGMLQKEVAERITAGPGSKIYGILSVLVQAYYDAEYLFSVKPSNFIPPPKVMSGVIRLKRNSRVDLGCEKALFFRVVKMGFQKRRKTLRNALKPINLPALEGYDDILQKRAEQLSVEQFIKLTQDLEKAWRK